MPPRSGSHLLEVPWIFDVGWRLNIGVLRFLGFRRRGFLRCSEGRMYCQYTDISHVAAALSRKVDLHWGEYSHSDTRRTAAEYPLGLSLHQHAPGKYKLINRYSAGAASVGVSVASVPQQWWTPGLQCMGLLLGALKYRHSFGRAQ